MKLLINSDFMYQETFNPSISDEDMFDTQEEADGLSELLDSLYVYHTLSVDTSGLRLIIPVQKLCLYEVDMNTLFYDVIDRFFDYDLQYSGLGGVGCDFSIDITPKLRSI